MCRSELERLERVREAILDTMSVLCLDDAARPIYMNRAVEYCGCEGGREANGAHTAKSDLKRAKRWRQEGSRKVALGVARSGGDVRLEN